MKIISLFPFCGVLFISRLTCFLFLSEENKLLEFCCTITIHYEYLFSCSVYVGLSSTIEALLKCLTFLCYLFIFKNEALKILGGFVWEWALSASRPRCRVIGQVSWHGGGGYSSVSLSVWFFSRAIQFLQKSLQISCLRAASSEQNNMRGQWLHLRVSAFSVWAFIEPLFAVGPLPCLSLCCVPSSESSFVQFLYRINVRSWAGLGDELLLGVLDEAVILEASLPLSHTYSHSVC